MNAIRSLKRGEAAGDNPCDADTLEWLVQSPPPVYNFLIPPFVPGRHPLWNKNDDVPSAEVEQARYALKAKPVGWRATLGTEVLTAAPESVYPLAGPSFKPLIAAIALTVAAIAVLLKSWILAAAGLVAAGGTILFWLLPDQRQTERQRESRTGIEAGLPLFSTGLSSPIWWGMVGAIAAGGMIFATLAYTYFYLRLFSSEWPQGSLPVPALGLSTVAFGALVLAVAPAIWSIRALRGENLKHAGLALALTALMAVSFIVIQLVDLSGLSFSPQTNAYASIYFLLNWATIASAGVGVILAIAALIATRNETAQTPGPLALQVEVVALYWRFVAVAALFVFAIVYIAPRVLP